MPKEGYRAGGTVALGDRCPLWTMEIGGGGGGGGGGVSRSETSGLGRR